MTKRSVRPATSSDAAVIAAMAQEFFTEVFNACALPAAHSLRAQVLTQTRQMWEETLAGNRPAQGQTLVALEEQTPVGFIAYSHAPALGASFQRGKRSAAFTCTVVLGVLDTHRVCWQLLWIPSTRSQCGCGLRQKIR